MKRIDFALVICSSLLFATVAWGDPVVKELYYSMKTSLAYPATYTFRFSLCTTETDGTKAVWSEEQTISMKGSMIKTYLGQFAPLEGLSFTEQYWVNVERKKKD